MVGLVLCFHCYAERRQLATIITNRPASKSRITATIPIQSNWKTLDMRVCLENALPHFSHRNRGFRLHSKMSAIATPPTTTGATG